MKVFDAMLLANAVEPVTQRFVRWRAYKKWLSQGPQVETGAADKQREPPATLDLFNLLRRFAGPFAGCVVNVRRDKINQVMRDTFALLEWDLRGCDLDL